MPLAIRLLCVVAFAAASLSAPAADPLRVFIRGGIKTHGPNQHDHPRFLGEWTRLLGERGLRVDGAMTFPTAGQLEQTDVLVIYASDGMKIVGEERTRFEAFLRRGGGVLAIHSGVVSGDEHAWCKEVIGGAWRWDLPPERRTKWLEGDVGIYWVDTGHPISRGLSNFDWKDEIYYDMDLAPDIGVLATSFHTVHIIAPQIWTYEKTWTGGTRPYRALVSLPGHEYDVFETPQYRTVLLRGLAWLGRQADIDRYCLPEELASLRYPPGGPLPAKDSMKTFSVHPEFTVSLAADENVAQKIMSLDWDPQGRLWVVETPEYPGGRDIHANDERISPWRAREPDRFPVGQKEPRPGRDRVSMLEDTNGDGVMDKQTVFADGLELPTSLVFYKDGVIVTQAPDILWIRDTNGDGKADRTEVLFTGWGTFDTHAVMSNLRWGHDGWIYGSVGYSAGEPRSADGSRRFGRITAGIFRFRPDGSALEQVAAGSCNTWGCEIAPDGEIFFSTATCGEPILHVVLPERVLSRAGVPRVRAARPIIEENKVFPPRQETRQPYVQIDWVGAWTSASGACVYDGGAWPGHWQGPSWSFFISEPTVWLFHHEFLDPVGVSYRGRREASRRDTHFLTSTDYWFKPIHSRVGPDGAMYLVDFYNQIAVHNDTRGPAHGARNAATRPDRDHEFTRLYRIQHKEALTLPPFRLDPREPAALVSMLDHPNGWVRVSANRLLSEGAGRRVLAGLEAKAAGAQTGYGRMHALWVLHNLDALDPELLLTSAGDMDPLIRRTAMRIAGERDFSDEDVPLDLAEARLNDSDPRTRLAALVAGANLTPTRPLADLVVKAWPTLRDPHLETAAMAMAAADPMLYIEAAFAAAEPSSVAGMVPHLARQIAQRNRASDARALVLLLARQPAATASLQAAALESLAANLRADVKPTADERLGNALRGLLGSEVTAPAVLPFIARWDFARQVGDATRAAVVRAEARLADRSLSDDERGQMAVNLLGVRSLDPTIVPAVAALVGGQESARLQRRVIDALGGTGDAVAGRALLEAMPRLEFDLREAAFGQLVQRVDWSGMVVEAMADGRVAPVLLGPSNLHRLRTHADRQVAARARSVLDELRGPEQKEKEALIARLLPEVIKPGNAARGAEVHVQNCAPCHEYKGIGANFAPSLTGMGAHGREELLVHILDPNRVVEPNYMSVSIETKDDLTYDGIVLRENNAVVVIRNQTAETEIRKDNIASRHDTGRSLMPEGYEELGVEALRDLLTYLTEDDQRYRILDLTEAFTANTSRGIYNSLQSRDESLRFRRWGALRHRDVPFDIVSPQRSPTGNNVIVLQGGGGMSRSYPREVEIRVGLPVAKLHFLGGVAGWGYPLGEENKPVVRVVVHFAGGATEEFVLRNGVEFADYIRRVDVPGSEALENLDQLLMQGRQLRYFARTLSRPGRVERITLASYNNEVAPTFVALTVELQEGTGSGHAAAPAPATTEPGPEPASSPVAVAETRPAPAREGRVRPAFRWGAGLNTLLVGGGAAHDYTRWFNLVDVSMLNAAGGISAGYVEPQDLSAGLVRETDVLVISANKPFPDARVRQAIFDHVEAGKGLVLVHAGVWYNWPDWPEFNRVLAGGGSRGHDRLGEFEVILTGGAHPLLEGVPDRFRIVDELYWFEPDAEGTPIKVLATAFSEQKQKAYPQVFVVEHEKARIVGLTLGHDGRAHSHEAYRTLLVNSVRWVAQTEPVHSESVRATSAEVAETETED
ncbi:MAG: ThuA domain-containing protein [Verrucomicrobiae bacterium]|nr:ThuA domain-containing protein [Verrucomicrobiae bacterium]